MDNPLAPLATTERRDNSRFPMHPFQMRLFCAFLCVVILLLPANSLTAQASTPDADTALAYVAADILQIRPVLDRLQRLRQEGAGPAGEELLTLRSSLLRKIFLGALDVRRACNKVEIELAYTYGILHREQRKQANINQALNLLNFAQFSTLYTIEPYSRVHKKFKQSAILGCVGAGVGIFLPVAGIVHNKISKAHNTAPPEFLGHVLDGGPVDTVGLPPLVERYFDSPDSQGQGSQKTALYATWKKRYGVDGTNKASLCSLTGTGGKSLGLLNTRLVLLWSLHNYIQDFDIELLALLRMVRSTSPVPVPSEQDSTELVALKPGAIEAAKLLKIQPLVEELIRLNKSQTQNLRKTELDISFLETVLDGMLDMNNAADKIDSEINYAYDIVLSQLLARRGKGLQLNYEANFIQTGVFGSIASLLFLKNYSKAANELFVIQGGIGTLLSTLGLLQLHGGWRKKDTPPNALAPLLNIAAKDSYSFPPLVSEFLSAPSPESNKGKSRRDFILDRWQQRHVATINLKNKQNQEKVAAASPAMDTIRIVRNRIDLLHSLKARLGEFNNELFELVEATDTTATVPGVGTGFAERRLNSAATGMVDLLGLQKHVEFALASGGTNSNELVTQQLFITRKVLLAALDARRTVSRLDLQIATETTAHDRILRQRDLLENLTNNANFFQISILGMIDSGPLSLAKDPKLNLYAIHNNSLSGIMVGGLAALTAVEQPGGLRLNKAEPNSIGAVFGLDVPANCRVSPPVLKFINSAPPNSTSGLSRRDELVDYWRKTKVTSADIRNRATLEKLAVNGPSHHFYSETLGLISDRIRMLYDTRAVIDLMNVGLSEILRATDG